MIFRDQTRNTRITVCRGAKVTKMAKQLACLDVRGSGLHDPVQFAHATAQGNHSLLGDSAFKQVSAKSFDSV